MEGQLQDTTVVIVEDDDALRSIVQRALLAEGCRTHCFGSPTQALNLLASVPADLLLADLGLPEIDGLTLIQRARAAQPSLPVVVMTGWETAQSAIAAADLGVDGYLSKPFNLKRLTDAGSWNAVIANWKRNRRPAPPAWKRCTLLGAASPTRSISR